MFSDICVSLAAQAPHRGARSPTQPHAHSSPPRADSLPCTPNALFFPGFAMMQPVALCARPARESSQHSSQNHAALGVGETCCQGQTLKSSVSAEDLRRKQDEVQVFVPRNHVCVCVSWVPVWPTLGRKAGRHTLCRRYLLTLSLFYMSTWYV